MQQSVFCVVMENGCVLNFFRFSPPSLFLYSLFKKSGGDGDNPAAKPLIVLRPSLIISQKKVTSFGCHLKFIKPTLHIPQCYITANVDRFYGTSQNLTHSVPTRTSLASMEHQRDPPSSMN